MQDETPDPRPIPRPSVGRIVHYHTINGDDLPLIITNVRSMDVVDGVVFNANPWPGEGEADAVREIPQGQGPGEWNWPPRV